MELHNLNVKIPVRSPAPATLEALIPVLHGWIQQTSRPEILIDVADYRHVPDGPGLVLIGLEADYSLDHSDGRWGVRYNRKAPVAGQAGDRLAQALQAALTAARALETEPALQGGLEFPGQELEIYIADRALARNDAATQAALRADLEPFLAALLPGTAVEIEPADADPRALPGMRIRCARPYSLQGLLDALPIVSLVANAL
jgi:hypothetical protein